MSTPLETWYEICNLICGYGANISVAELKRLLDKREADLNRHDASNRTLLDYCIIPTVTLVPFSHNMLKEQSGQYIRMNMASLLIQYGADVNATDKSGWSVVHQCAINGDLTMMQFFIYKGAKSNMINNEGQMPLDLAVLKGYTHIVRYLEVQSKSLKCLCRLAIRDAMGKRSYNRINELPLPSSLKLFVNYGSPFPGWTVSVYVPCPWSKTEIVKGNIDKLEVLRFIEENASREFVEERCDEGKKMYLTNDELAEIIEALYFWEAFKTIDYEEPIARKPRYSLEKLPDDEMTENSQQLKYLTKLFRKFL